MVNVDTEEFIKNMDEFFDMVVKNNVKIKIHEAKGNAIIISNKEYKKLIKSELIDFSSLFLFIVLSNHTQIST